MTMLPSSWTLPHPHEAGYTQDSTITQPQKQSAQNSEVVSPAVHTGAEQLKGSVVLPSSASFLLEHDQADKSRSKSSVESSNFPGDYSLWPVSGVRVIPPPMTGKRKVVAKSSIAAIDGTLYIQECEAAAIASRLPPNNMSEAETSLMRDHLSHLQITSYVTCRNAILRLWIKNPMLWITIEEAQGVAREERHFPLCRQIWEFLIRHGYINYGCLDVPEISTENAMKHSKRILVIGAGIAGLSTARHIEALLSTFQDKLPFHYKVTLLEARARIGGRVYSHQLKQHTQYPDAYVDLGAQIVTGFSGGNPLTTLLQRQLGLPYHSLVHARNNKIYGPNGQQVGLDQDARVEGLFNLLLDAAARFRYVARLPSAADNEQNMASPAREGAATEPFTGEEVLKNGPVTVSVADKVLGVGKSSALEASRALSADPKDELRDLGYQIFEHSEYHMPEEAESLGQTLENILEAYTKIASIGEGDKLFLRWHWANMEYACGTNLENLSLRHWDQDDGNEFRGNHAMLIGGYSKLARGLALAPSKLDVLTRTPVQKILQNEVILKSGESISADKIIVTVPLGVLKSKQIIFEPELPEWKTAAIDRLGFGLLNKVVLTYESRFWDTDIDLFGTTPATSDRSDNPDIHADRGRFYMFWDCTAHASGRPVLVALMAGDAAFACENMDNQTLISEATAILQRIYPNSTIPVPSESVITKWGRDEFSLGSYSYIGRTGSGADYEALARPIDDSLFFAGEATCRTHPSTVHGAYLSGLAAARAVLDSIIGVQKIPSSTPLVPTKHRTTPSHSTKLEARKRPYDARDGPPASTEDEVAVQMKKSRLTKRQEVLQRIVEGTLGPRPQEPKKTNANPFLVFQKDQWNACKKIADEQQQKKQNTASAKATKNQIRACLGQTWRDTPESGRKQWVS